MDINAVAQGISDQINAKDKADFFAGRIDDLDVAYRVQDAVGQRIGSTCGRKIALNSNVLMEMAKISEPIVGHIVGASPHENGVTLSLNDFAELALEPEIACVLAADIPAKTTVSKADVAHVIASFTVAFEVLDRRFAPLDFHAPSFVANNVFNAGVVLGAGNISPLDMDGANYSARMLNREGVLLDGQNTAPQDPIAAVLFVINHFTNRGQTLAKGEVILCGTHLPPVAVTKPDHFEFAIEPGAFVSLTISD